MKKISIITLIASIFVSTFAVANEVNVFNARHYKADAELYSKFTSMTGIKVNLINGKSGALEKRIIEEGADSSADLYITADAGRCGQPHQGLLHHCRRARHQDWRCRRDHVDHQGWDEEGDL